ncbi:MAG: hypothetical protein WB615_11235 [Candidatus Tumulicola sp.]
MAVVAGLAGFLIGRWLLPSNGPCALDYGLVAAWLTGTATLLLVVIAACAAYYAYGTASAALETLALEREPILLVEIDTDKPPARPDMQVEITKPESHLLISSIVKASECGLVRIKIRSIGRGPALNAKVTLVLDDVDAEEKVVTTLSTPCFIQSIAPGEAYRLWLHNGTQTRVLRVTITDAMGDSSTAPVKPNTPLRLHRSSALPFHLGPG